MTNQRLQTQADMERHYNEFQQTLTKYVNNKIEFFTLELNEMRRRISILEEQFQHPK